MSLSGRDTLLRKYNVDNPMFVPGFAKKAGQRHLETMIDRDGEDWAKKLFKRVSESYGGVHPINSSSSNQSRAETEIIESLIDLGVDESDIIQGDRTVLSGKEIDVYLPKWNIGVELCGEYWHSEQSKPDKIHVFHKFEMARDLGVQIITVFENEWKQRKIQVINNIASKIFEFPKVYARSCSFEEISPSEAKQFVSDNQIQKMRISPKRAFGLRYNGDIVQVMTFNSNKITRVCSEIGCRVVGGASKLLRESMNALSIGTVTTISDNRFSNGDLLKTIGFVKVKSNYPGHFFADKRGRHFIKAGTDRVKLYDCGSITWEYSRG